MNDSDITKIFNDSQKITAAIMKSIKECIRIHKLMGYPMCVWRNGKVIWIEAKDL